VTDDPFVETRDQPLGYFLIDANDLNVAIGIAPRISIVRKVIVEIRSAYLTL
jgi:hypothetical protein